MSRYLNPQEQGLLDSRRDVWKMAVDGMGKVDKAECSN